MARIAVSTKANSQVSTCSVDVAVVDAVMDNNHNNSLELHTLWMARASCQQTHGSL